MKKLVLSLLFLFQAVFVMAQNQSTVKGKVVDSKSQSPLGSVKVMIQSNEQFVTTNSLGEFQISGISVGNQILVISVDGYNTQNFPIEVVANQRFVASEKFFKEPLNN